MCRTSLGPTMASVGSVQIDGRRSSSLGTDTAEVTE